MKKCVAFLIICFFSYSYSQSNQYYLFNESNSPLNVSNLLSLAVDSSDIIWIGAQDILYKYDHGNWELIDTLLQLPGGLVNDIDVSSEGDIWICISRGFGSYANGLYKYGSGWINGINGTYDPSLIFIDGLDNLWVTFINWWPHQMLLDAIGKYDGSDWEVIYSFEYTGFGDLVVRNDTIFVTTFWGDLYGYTDSTWQLIIPYEDWQVKNIWEHKNRMWIGGEKFGEFYGDTFAPIEQITNFLDSTSSKSTSLSLGDNNVLWIGTDNGHIIRFENRLEVVAEYPGNKVVDIEIDKYNNKWFLINNIGLLIYNEDGILEVQSSSDFATSSYSLSQNYPNPFNPTTVITYRLSVTGNVTLKVYDIIGNEIAILINEEKQTGEYEVTFDATGLPSGIYFYQLKTGSFKQTKKMILLK